MDETITGKPDHAVAFGGEVLAGMDAR